MRRAVLDGRFTFVEQGQGLTEAGVPDSAIVPLPSPVGRLRAEVVQLLIGTLLVKNPQPPVFGIHRYIVKYRVALMIFKIEILQGAAVGADGTSGRFL